MKRALLFFAAVGGLAVPIVFTLLGWALRRSSPGDAGVLALLHDVQLPLWPMSKLILDDPSSKHWLYLPLAALLSNALVYAVVGALSASGRTVRLAYPGVLATVALLLYLVHALLGTGATGLAIATALALFGLIVHHRAR